MTSARTALIRWGNTLGVWLYRHSGGRITGPAKGTTIGLLTVPGRHTGILRTVAIGFFPHGLGYLVAGSGSGSRQDPQWFRNLRVAEHAQIQIGGTCIDVGVRIAENAERDTLWHQVILLKDPRRRRYQKKAGRIIPIAVLTPINPSPEQARITLTCPAVGLAEPSLRPNGTRSSSSTWSGRRARCAGRRRAVAHRQRRRTVAAGQPRCRAGAAAVPARARLRPALPAQAAVAVRRRPGRGHPRPSACTTRPAPANEVA
jgi:deazaflavin-dependent oxidoreductase (nitroreductase family)